MKKIVIVTGDQYPFEDAGAIREHAIAKIFEMLGYSVTVIGYGKSTNGQLRQYDGVRYLSMRPKSANKIVRGVCRVTFAHKALSYVKKHLSDVDAILIVEFSKAYGYKIFEKYALKHNMRLIHDSVEWYSPEQFANGEKSKTLQLKNLVNETLVSKNWNVIAISQYLEEHFKKQCHATVRIPVIMDMDQIGYRTTCEKNEKKIKLVYAGSPGRKDYLHVMISGLVMLTEAQKQRLEFHIIGVNEMQLISACGVAQDDVTALKDVLHVHGRVSHDEAVRWVKDADYTLLLRDPSLRYAKAGFPTKIVESLACGTPPICNLSSDLGLYLVDSQNSFLIDDVSPQSVKRTLDRVLECGQEKMIEMRCEARKSAIRYFDYKNYLEGVKALLK